MADDPYFASCQPIAKKGVRRPRSTRLRLSPGGHVPGRVPAAPTSPGCAAGQPLEPTLPSAGGTRGRLSPGPTHPGATRRCSSQRSQSQPAEEDQPMLAPFPKASRHQGVEAAFWLPQAWSTVNNMPAVSADKPSLMRLQQKHSNMHYRTSVGIFFLELVFRK